METTPQITFHGVDASPNLTSIINEKIAKLDQTYDRITSCRVTVERRTSKGHKGKLYKVAVELEVPGGAIIVNRKPGDLNAHEDPRVAIRDSFDAALRQLRDHQRKVGGVHVKSHPDRLRGTVVRVFADEGYGFAKMTDGREVFFDRASVTGEGWEQLDLNCEITFSLMQGEKGLYAANVTLSG
ncbi:HPF/RaiA family ribosome-associated protein [Marimonas arenosa]|uniref:HPF/RaiA family ribosome-associated protein n=1 Tax=Marimonas arenosa TaxID=1795305 RepID=A0AAE4B4G5_9RHOB|nr:HPF/RaiA family ribosome-associated protein [Marimonas arenosa]MDQ2091023.1 HPF/RaiA family ribosome-associated protein [Marimonas arenosa]